MYLERGELCRQYQNKIQTFINKCLLRICIIFWPNIISNQEVYRITNCCRKWNWIGHTLRKVEDKIAQMTFEWNPQSTRRKGRPIVSWIWPVHSEGESWVTAQV